MNVKALLFAARTTHGGPPGTIVFKDDAGGEIPIDLIPDKEQSVIWNKRPSIYCRLPELVIVLSAADPRLWVDIEGTQRCRMCGVTAAEAEVAHEPGCPIDGIRKRNLTDAAGVAKSW